MTEPQTETGKGLHQEAWDWPDGLTVDGHSSDPATCPACDILARIEAEAIAIGEQRTASIVEAALAWRDSIPEQNIAYLRGERDHPTDNLPDSLELLALLDAIDDHRRGR